MIDFLTLRADFTQWEEGLVRALMGVRNRQGRIMRINGQGEIEWEQFVRETIRADSHQVVLYISSSIEITGSPARSAGLAHNVFGPDDLEHCYRLHIEAVERGLGVELPRQGWRIARVDFTENYDLGGVPEVRQALAYLRQAEGGRYKLRSVSETVYWSPGSRYISAKAYHKGPHLRYQIKREQARAERWEQEMADRLLRLERRYGSQFCHAYGYDLRRLIQVDFRAEHQSYWAGLVGKVELADMSELRERVIRAAPTEGQGLAAYRTWQLISAVGQQATRESMPRRTWYRHVKILHAAGLAWGDLAAGQVVPLRRKPIVLQAPVKSWADMGVTRAA